MEAQAAAVRVEGLVKRFGEALALAPLIRFFEEHDVDVTEARAIRPSLEDVFVRITGVAVEQMRKEKQQQGKRR